MISFRSSFMSPSIQKALEEPPPHLQHHFSPAPPTSNANRHSATTTTSTVFDVAGGMQHVPPLHNVGFSQQQQAATRPTIQSFDSTGGFGGYPNFTPSHPVPISSSAVPISPSAGDPASSLFGAPHKSDANNLLSSEQKRDDSATSQPNNDNRKNPSADFSPWLEPQQRSNPFAPANGGGPPTAAGASGSAACDEMLFSDWSDFSAVPHFMEGGGNSSNKR